MESILRHQRAFFEEGPTKLKPLVLRDIADDTGMHESTVSRITTNKFVATAHGIYELKYFFNSAIEIEDGNQIGSESVKALIKKFITEEDSKNPLSDEKIVELLKEELYALTNQKQIKTCNHFMVFCADFHKIWILAKEKGIDIPELLVASHIIPWSDSPKERLNPENGICLSSLYDKAFDQGLISFDNSCKVLFSERLSNNVGKDYYNKYFLPIYGKSLAETKKYAINPLFLEWHRDCIFNK